MLVVDARCLAQRFSGIQRYTLHVLKALVRSEALRGAGGGGVRVLLADPGGIDHPLHDALQAAGVELLATGAAPSLLHDQRPGRWRAWLAGTGDAPTLLCPDAFAPLRAPRGHAGLRRVITLHDVIPLVRAADLRRSWKGRAPWLWRRWLRAQVRAADRVLTVSVFSRQDIARVLGVRADRISVVGNAVEPLADAAPERQVRAPYVLCVGRADPYKNQVGLVEAFSSLLEQPEVGSACPGLRLVLAGTADPRYPEADARAQALGVADRVDRVQPTQAQLAALYRDAAVVAVPSLYEGFGLPAVEAMLAGAPVVSSDAASLPEVVGDAALMVDAADRGALASTMSRVLLEPVLRGALVKRGHANAARWSLDHFAERLASALRR